MALRVFSSLDILDRDLKILHRYFKSLGFQEFTKNQNMSWSGSEDISENLPSLIKEDKDSVMIFDKFGLTTQSKKTDDFFRIPMTVLYDLYKRNRTIS